MALDVENTENTAPPSTPATASHVFSSDAPGNDVSSPPSSPPAFPRELKEEPREQDANIPADASPQNVFSILGKRKLAPVSHNSVSTAVKKLKRHDDGKTQMQLHLGQKIQKTCKDCGMQYVASSKEDQLLHAKFHKQHTEGVDVGVHLVESAPTGTGRRVFNGVAKRQDDKIVMVDCFDKKPRRRKAQEVLEIVQRDLGAVEIAESDVWEAPRGEMAEPKYRSFLYTQEGKCIGFLLVERIKEAFEVLPPKVEPGEAARSTPPIAQPTAKRKQSSLEALKARKIAAEVERAQKEASLQAAAKKPLVLSEQKAPAVLGICRIWTLPSHRGQGIAIALLDTAVQWHNGHVKFLQLQFAKMEKNYDSTDSKALSATKQRTLTLQRIEKKDQVAFSQPTAAGTKLARKWTGRLSGWKVYVD